MSRLIGLIALLVALTTPAAAVHAAGHGLADEFMCQCGCGLTVASCTHASCAPRDQMLAEIARLQAAGNTDAQIRAVFVATFGEAVLAAPTKRGFNLVAWWGPYAALLAGAVAIAALGTAWARRPRDRAARATSTLTPEQQALLQKELDAFQD